MTLIVGLLAGSSSLAGCVTGGANKANHSGADATVAAAAGAAKVDAGDASADDDAYFVEPTEESVKKALDGLQAPLDELSTKFMTLHKQFDALPPDLPGFYKVRSKFYETEEGGMGIMRPKLRWLSDRFDVAQRSKNPDDMRKVAKDVAGMYRELRELDGIATELIHRVLPFERMKRLQDMDITGPTPFERLLVPTNFDVLGATDGIEQLLLDFIADPSRKVDEKTWIDFDRPLFEGSRADLDPRRMAAAHQLANVAQILKAYPSVKLKIGAFTDNTGDAAANKKLTEKRADAVKDELVRLGVAAKRLTTEGYGEEHPVCPPNDTDACKSRNRRISALVTAK